MIRTAPVVADLPGAMRTTGWADYALLDSGGGRKLDKEGLEYEKLDGTTPEAVAHLKSLGYQQLPVVFYGGEHWSGFRPDLIQQIAASQQ